MSEEETVQYVHPIRRVLDTVVYYGTPVAIVGFGFAGLAELVPALGNLITVVPDVADQIQVAITDLQVACDPAIMRLVVLDFGDQLYTAAATLSEMGQYSDALHLAGAADRLEQIAMYVDNHAVTDMASVVLRDTIHMIGGTTAENLERVGRGLGFLTASLFSGLYARERARNSSEPEYTIEE
jgi:hypothetical protein